ncbi:hypothetical protein J2W28_000240 [Variovorax boronicumulans]|uniref:hypothetical protein n=1 Tax=Variovorax boronicumulans TaxID=436515 RepID=UPI002781E984|nr:hypothetical protein [Variovorax boronicumulans]MDP9990377.1 hypothetical protein [Variovorax boronicumulans]MDQ0001112.1 hypothetical protein [Variovorax boronicumulans]
MTQTIFKGVEKMLPTRARLRLERKRMNREFSKDLAQARAAKDPHQVQQIEGFHQHFSQLQTEEEDAFETQQMLSKARRLRVPRPPLYDKSGSETDDWYKAFQLDEWCLTTAGMAKLRDAIRAELKARHEGRTRWIAWISALSGLLGIATALVALLVRGKA